MSFTPINKPGSNYRCVWGTNRSREIDITGFDSLENSGLRPFVIAAGQISEYSMSDSSSENFTTSSSSEDFTANSISNITPPSTPTSPAIPSPPIYFPSPKKWHPSKFTDAKEAAENTTPTVSRSKVQGKHSKKSVAKREHWSISKRKRKICHEHNSKLWLSWFNSRILIPLIEREKRAEQQEKQAEAQEDQAGHGWEQAEHEEQQAEEGQGQF